ncbi:hypothetical protein MKZ38_000514 [Zalerion maritima]|uniref:glucan endo-1,3-beta-D-glucosidase n=1 Tax=Zalerion maritima TaxID=339359 RepID=A0AAD5RG55_9PEZI|nr:hypothetical protein MKZ38_000514 [Zalerion maritima]
MLPFSSVEHPPAPSEQEPLQSSSRHHSPGPAQGRPGYSTVPAASPHGSPAFSPSTPRGRQQQKRQYAPVRNQSHTPSPTRGPIAGQSARLSQQNRPYRDDDPNERTNTVTRKGPGGKNIVRKQAPVPPQVPQHNPSTINRKAVRPTSVGNSRDIASSASKGGAGSPAETQAATQFPNTSDMSRRGGGGGGPQVDSSGRYWGADAGYPQPAPGVTPGADNFSERAAGGMAGIAYSVAEHQARQSGMDAVRPADPNSPQEGQYRSPSSERNYPGKTPFSERSGQQYDQQQQYDQRQQPYTATTRNNQQHGTDYDQRQHQQQDYYNNHHHPSSPQQPHQPYDHAAYDTRQHQQGYHGSHNDNSYDRGYDSRGGYQGGARSLYVEERYSQTDYPPTPTFIGGRFASDRESANSVAPLGGGAAPGRATPTYHDGYDQRSPYGHGHSHAAVAAGVGYGAAGGQDMYANDPYQRYAPQYDDRVANLNPNDIVDDGDDGLEYRRPPRTSLLSLGRSSNHDSHNNHGAAAGAVAGAGVMAAASAAGKTVGNRLSGMYNSVANTSSSRSVNRDDGSGHGPGMMMAGGAAGGGGGAAAAGYGAGGAGGSAFELNNAAASGSARDVMGGGGSSHSEKPSGWIQEQESTRKKWKWVIIGLVIVVVLAGVACGVVFGVVLKDDDSSSGSSSGGSSSDAAVGGGGGLTAGEDTAANGDLDINSDEIQALLNNDDLHKVFAAMDYTALNTQYPDCEKWPPSQNNITRDMAVLSQLTNTVRLYGTDCNQTQMVIHAINQLEMQDTMKVWLGVWQDGNTTTNARQLGQMWDILDEYGTDPFLGVIVANEILFREEMTITELQTLLQEVRDNITALGYEDIIVATSDLGDNWTEQLAEISDAIMGNIHPFFAGIDVSEASEWTTTFWDGHIGTYKKSENKLNIIAETGWPTGGGSINASMAGVEEANQFMEDWVCRAMDEKISYFWFEAFDEPWKIRFNEEGKEWEDKWGILTVNRNLKDGIVVPDCDGKTIDDVDW